MKTKNRTVEPLVLQRILKLTAILVVLTAAHCSQALMIVSGPLFTPAANAALAGVLALTTDVDSQVSVSVSDGIGTWDRYFYDYGTNHSEILLGFKANRTNQITVTVRDKYRNTFTYAQSIPFVTSPFPMDMPAITPLTNNPDLMEPGYTLFRAANNTTGSAFVTIVDNAGQVVWYDGDLPTISDVLQLTNGNLFFPVNGSSSFIEADMLGQTVTTLPTPSDYPQESHEDLLTDHGSLLYLSLSSMEISNFPTSATDSNAPTATSDVSYDWVVEISVTNSTLLNTWSLIDLLDPLRIDYLCFLIPVYGIDEEHANAIIEDPSDDSLIVSLRNQDAIVKFSRSGQLKWILGPHENWGAEWQPYLLTPIGTPFEWNYAQHAPLITPQGTLLCYDDGNCRAEPFDPPVADQNNYSRAVEFRIDETNMQVSQVWEYTGTNDDRLYTGALGNATLLPRTGNVLVNFGYVSYENGVHPDPIAPKATIVHLKEVTHQPNPSVVLDLQLTIAGNTNTNSVGCSVYRSHRIPDLYSHQAVPVANLTVQFSTGVPTLRFSADPSRNYVVLASDDLVNWQEIGSASPDNANGDFSFPDEDGNDGSVLFYRVLTQ